MDNAEKLAVNKRQLKPTGQSRMDNPEKLAVNKRKRKRRGN